MRKIYHSAKGGEIYSLLFAEIFLFLYFQKLHLLLEFRNHKSRLIQYLPNPH